MHTENLSKSVDYIAAAESAGLEINRENWCRDVIVGPIGDLQRAGIVTEAELRPQAGRPLGRTAFYSDGSPVPPGLKGQWRIPGHKVIYVLGFDRLRVEISISSEGRRQRNEEIEAETARELASRPPIQRPLVYEWLDWGERWEGTKAQLQAVGIGIGVAFPGEMGAQRTRITVRDQAGFSVSIKLHWDSDRQGTPGADNCLYTAYSLYVERDRAKPVGEQFALGVRLYTDSPWTDSYVGTAEALIACGLARIEQFPGQPGRGRVQCSYKSDGTPATSSPQVDRGMMIKREGHGRYRIEVPVLKEETRRRQEAEAAHQAIQARHDEAGKRERMKARGIDPSAKFPGLQQTSAPLDLATIQAMRAAGNSLVHEHMMQVGTATTTDFREAKLKVAEGLIDDLWTWVFVKAAGPMKYRILEEDDEYAQLADAFGAIRDAVKFAKVQRDTKAQAALRLQQRADAARSDLAFQRALGSIIISSSKPNKGGRGAGNPVA